MAEPLPAILLIEDEQAIRRFVKASLTGRGYRVVEATTASEGLALVDSHRPELILLDLGLPDQDGLDVIRTVRKSSAVPIIVLSARGKEQDKIAALDAGAEDYLTKPFGIGELQARIRVCLRHARRAAEGPDEPVFRVGELSVDLEKREVTVGKRDVHLTPLEYKVLALLVRHAGRVVTQKQLLAEIWGSTRGEETQYLRIYIHQLRQKLEANPVRPKLLMTEAGVGYRLRDE